MYIHEPKERSTKQNCKNETQRGVSVGEHRQKGDLWSITSGIFLWRTDDRCYAAYCFYTVMTCEVKWKWSAFYSQRSMTRDTLWLHSTFLDLGPKTHSEPFVGSQYKVFAAITAHPLASLNRDAISVKLWQYAMRHAAVNMGTCKTRTPNLQITRPVLPLCHHDTRMAAKFLLPYLSSHKRYLTSHERGVFFNTAQHHFCERKT